MNSGNYTPELFPMTDSKTPTDDNGTPQDNPGGAGNVFEYPRNDLGVIGYAGLRHMVRSGELQSTAEIAVDQIQPALEESSGQHGVQARDARLEPHIAAGFPGLEPCFHANALVGRTLHRQNGPDRAASAGL